MLYPNSPIRLLYLADTARYRVNNVSLLKGVIYYESCKVTEVGILPKPVHIAFGCFQFNRKSESFLVSSLCWYFLHYLL